VVGTSGLVITTMCLKKPAMTCTHWKNLPMLEKKNRNKNSNAAFGTILAIEMFLQLQAETSYLFFSLTRQP
jgi:hypothetical protein